MGGVRFETILSDACSKFVEEIDKFESWLISESDFRCAIYAELVKVMDEKRLTNYPILTEYNYGDKKADISLGEDRDVAVELKFGFYRWGPSPRQGIRDGRDQLAYYLKNGAKKAYLVFFDFWPPGERASASEIVDVDEFGLSGEWKEVSTHQGFVGDLLIATIT